ncbi:MAG: toll/interleukin-1 receptor domain-containing protein [Prochlorotrichaceae cyanobacterium]
MNEFQDAFISYGRADSKLFAKTLNDRLTTLGYTIWFDFDDIPLGVDYQKQIDDAIAKSDNMIFVIAPHSINSPYCKLELDLATHYRKRIIPILHVEQIDQATWERRNPGKPEADWQAYKAAGKHSSFVNMHTEVSRINWIYMREDVDDFESGLAGLVSVLNRQRAYVNEHTLILDRALLWQTHAKQSAYLLTGEELQDAEQWLKKKFSTDQPPCRPTALHCEFISESLKYAQGGLTDVFICYTDHDRSFAELLRNSLIKRGITVWLKDQDLVFGEDETIATKKGVEEACNFVYLVSENSLECRFCLEFLKYANGLNKRIIPIKITESVLALPDILKHLNTINLADNLSDQDYSQDEADLIKILALEEDYHARQRDLLVRALKWDRQNHNRSILLRGNHLQKIQVWLNIALRHSQYPPSSVQIDFVKASLAEPEPEYLDIFLYCTATDSDLGRRINHELQLQGKLIYFNIEMLDSSDVSVGSFDLEVELSKQIQGSSNCVFVLSPTALIDPIYCIALDQATDLNKRILFVEYRPVEANDLPRNIAATFIPFSDDFWAGFNHIMRILEVDREYVQEHTRWLQRSLRWAESDRSEDFLLRGNEFVLATDWLNSALADPKIPEVNPLQKELVQASLEAKIAAEEIEKNRQNRLLQLQADRAKEAEARLVAEQKIASRQKLFLIAVSTGLALSIALTFLALWSYWRSVVKANLAEKREVEVLMELSNSQFATHQTLESLITAIQASRKLEELSARFPQASNLKPDVLEVLQQAVYRVKELNRLTGHQGRVYSVAVSPDGRWIVSGGDDKILRLWTHEGFFVKGFSGHQGRILDLAFSPDGRAIASSGTEGIVRILRKSGRIKNTLAVNAEVFSLAFNPQFTAKNPATTNTGTSEVYLVTADRNGVLKLWSEDGELLREIQAHNQPILKIVFAHQSQTLWSASTDGTVKHWNLEDGTLIRTLKHDRLVHSLALSSDDQFIATGSGNGILSLWEATTGQRRFSEEAHQSVIADVKFAQQGRFLISASWDNTMKIWQLDGTLINQIEDHGAPVQSLAIDPSNAQVILSGSWDGTVRLWSGDFNKLIEFNSRNQVVRDLKFSADQSTLWVVGSNRQLEQWDWQSISSKSILSSHNNDIARVAIHPQETWLATGSWDGRISLWTKTGEFVRSLEGHRDRITDLDFTADGQFLLSSSSDGTLRRWDLTQAPDTISTDTLARSPDEMNAFDFSADGQWLVTGSANGYWQLLNGNGEVVSTTQGHNAPITDVAFLTGSDYIITASLDRTIKVWDHNGKLIQTLTGHLKGIPKLAVHPQGNIFASIGIDRTVRLWQLEEDKVSPLITIRGYREGVLGVAFSPDGQFLATGDAGAQVLVWKWQSLLNPEQLLQQGCSWLEDYLNPNRTTLEGIDPQQLCPEPDSSG